MRNFLMLEYLFSVLCEMIFTNDHISNGSCAWCCLKKWNFPGTLTRTLYWGLLPWLKQKKCKMQVHQANIHYMFMVSYIVAFVAFVTSTIWNPASLSLLSDVFRTVPTMCKASLL
jgi:hypothetical protein